MRLFVHLVENYAVKNHRLANVWSSATKHPPVPGETFQLRRLTLLFVIQEAQERSTNLLGL